jgi:hypothetical protein
MSRPMMLFAIRLLPLAIALKRVDDDASRPWAKA